jgi:hypothetical protein
MGGWWLSNNVAFSVLGLIKTSGFEKKKIGEGYIIAAKPS